MATLFELKDEILKGRRVKRSGIKYAFYSVDEIEGRNVFADDWELEPLPKEKKKIMLYAHSLDNLGKHEHSIFFSTCPSIGYLRLPDLDQEIEVDE